MAASTALFRASFAAYLVEAACDLTLSVMFYALLRPVDRYLSLLAAFFGLLSTATFASAEIFYYAASLPVLDVDVERALSPDSRAVFIYLALTIFGYAFGIFTAFYGITIGLRGYLIARSSYFPRAIGGILLLGGAAFVVKNFVVVLAPRFDSQIFVVPLFLAMICLAGWLLVKGVDRARWDQLGAGTADPLAK